MPLLLIAGFYVYVRFRRHSFSCADADSAAAMPVL